MDLYDTVLLVGTVQGFVLVLALLVKNFGKKKQNYFFLLLVIGVSIGVFAKYSFTIERYKANPHFWYFADLLTYTVGPLWYFTIRKSIQPSIRLKASDWLLLSPILYHFAFLVRILSYENLELLALEGQPWFTNSFYAFCLTVLVVNTGFLLKADLLIRRHKDTQFPDLLVKGQYAFLAILAIWLGSFIVGFVVGQEVLPSPTSAYHYAFISLAFLTFMMAFLALVKPASFYFLTQTYDGGEHYILKQIAEKAQAYIQEQEAFLSVGFSLGELSEAIQSNPVLTSKAINRILNKSFSDLINEYRVNYFLKLARQEKMQQLTHWAIAQEAGFGNKVTFYKAFKKATGATPKVYLDTYADA